MTNSTNKSFILHLDSLVILEKLSDEQAGKIFKSIYNYQKKGEIEKLDFALDLALTPFVNQFLRDDEKYKITCERRKEAGAKGGKQKVANASKSKQKIANLADSDSKNKSDSDSDSKNESKSEVMDIYQELSDSLRLILEAKLNRTIKTTGWKEEIKKLIQNDLKPRQNALEDVKRAIQAVSDHSGKQYFPVIQAASSLREKFTKIENFLNNLNPKQINGDNSYLNYLTGGQK